MRTVAMSARAQQLRRSSLPAGAAAAAAAAALAAAQGADDRSQCSSGEVFGLGTCAIIDLSDKPPPPVVDVELLFWDDDEVVNVRVASRDAPTTGRWSLSKFILITVWAIRLTTCFVYRLRGADSVDAHARHHVPHGR